MFHDVLGSNPCIVLKRQSQAKDLDTVKLIIPSTMFYIHTRNDKVMVLIVYSDDIILIGNDETDFREEKVS